MYIKNHHLAWFLIDYKYSLDDSSQNL